MVQKLLILFLSLKFNEIKKLNLEKIGHVLDIVEKP